MTLIQACEIVRKYIEENKTFIYTNKYKRPKTLAEAKKVSPKYINCVYGIYFAMRLMGDLPNNMTFYGYKGKIVWSDGCKDKLKKNGYKILSTAKGKTVNEAIKNNLIKPNDIVFYQELVHSNVYKGNGYWYDFGSGYNAGSGEGTKIKKVYGKTIYGSQKISYILRKTVKETPKVVYRVQVGVFSTDKALNALVTKIKSKTNLPCFSEKSGDNTYLFCGSFGTKSNAQERVDLLKSKGINAIIKEVRS